MASPAQMFSKRSLSDVPVLDGLFKEPGLVAYYRALPFGAWLDGYVEDLRSQGYGNSAVHGRLGRLRVLGEFLQEQGLAAEVLAQETFLPSYLDTWERAFQDRHGRPPRRAHWLAVRCTARSLAAFARRARYLPPSEQAPVGPPLLEQYLDYCRHHRGIGESACGAHRFYLLRLATFCRERGVDDLSGIAVPVLDAFIEHEAGRLQRESLHGVVGMVRSFLRYLFLIGQEPTDRSRLLESPSMYRAMKLPRHLSDGQLAEVLARVDRATVRGRRDWAALTLLITYGLRVGEVARLRLQDVELEAGRLHVRRVKGGGEQIFPLTAAVADALNTYLTQARPPSAHPEIFLTLRVPVRPFAHGHRLAAACVTKYMPESGVLPARGGHALRHTVARRLRQSGAGLGVVRRILGHRDVNTTGRYLRIALDELREVADNYAELL